MAPNKRTSTPKPTGPKKNTPRKPGPKKAEPRNIEPKKTPIAKKQKGVTFRTEEQIHHEMQELDFEEHEERQRKKLLAKDMESKGNSKVSDPADENVDIKMEEDETQVVDGVGTHTPEADELETEGCDFQEGKETEHVTGGGEPQATEAGGFQAGDYHENAAQPEGEALPPNNTEATEGAVREAPSAHNPEVRVAQIIGGAASVGGSPFIGTMKKQQRDSSSASATTTPKTATEEQQDDFETLGENVDFMEFSKIQQQELEKQDNKNLAHNATINVRPEYNPKIGLIPKSVPGQTLASTHLQVPHSVSGLPVRGPPRRVAQLRGGAVNSVDPLFQFKPAQLPPTTKGPSSRPGRGGRQSAVVNNNLVNNPVLSASALSPATSDPMGPTLHEEKFIVQGITNYFKGKIPPNFRFDTMFLDKLAHILWDAQIKHNPETHDQISVMAAQYSPFKLRILARLSIIPSWWWIREQIVTVLRKSGKWVVEDSFTDLKVKNAVDFQILYDQVTHGTNPFDKNCFRKL